MSSKESENSAALRVLNLRKTYKAAAAPALDGVTFEVGQGEFFGLLGPNGAGKSTLIGTVAGLVKPDAGSAYILGRDTVKEPRFTKMAVGIVPQEITFDPFFTVRETLRLQSGFYGIRHNDIWISTLISRLGLSDKINEKVSRLSGGMKRRVLIAQALVHKPPVIILDEPTAGVDVELRHRIWDFMQELHAHGHTIILTTHYLEEAQSLCGRIALLNGGKLAALDTTKALLSRFSGKRLRFTLRSGSLPAIADFVFERIGQTNDYAVSYRNDTDILTVLQALQSTARIDDIHTGESSLEEVFLHLTNSDKRP